MLIFSKMIAVMREIQAVGKNNKNSAQGYTYRGIEDITNHCHPLLAKHGIFLSTEVLSERTEERLSPKGTALLYRVLHVRFHFHAEDGSAVHTEAIGEGMDTGDKAANKAMSAAYKYAFTQTFVIPTKEMVDSEVESHEVRPKDQLFEPHHPQHRARLVALLNEEFDVLDPERIERISTAVRGTPLSRVKTKVGELVNGSV